MFKITLDRELGAKLIQKNSLPSSAYESQFSDKQKISHRTKKKTTTQYRSPEQLIVYTVITVNNLFCLMIYEGWNFISGNYLFTTDTK